MMMTCWMRRMARGALSAAGGGETKKSASASDPSSKDAAVRGIGGWEGRILVPPVRLIVTVMFTRSRVGSLRPPWVGKESRPDGRNGLRDGRRLHARRGPGRVPRPPGAIAVLHDPAARRRARVAGGAGAAA